MMRLTPTGMFNLFKPTLENIIRVLNEILDKPDLAGGVDYMFLVGGFAESPVLQKHLRDAFADKKIQVIIPQGEKTAQKI